MGSAKRIGDSPVGIVCCPYITHSGGQRGFVAGSFRAESQCVVYFIAVYALEEDLQVEVFPVRASVKAISEPGEGIAQIGEVLIVDFAVAVLVGVAGIAGMVFLGGSWCVQMFSDFFITGIDAFIIITPEGVQGKAFSADGAVPVHGSTAVKRSEFILDERNVSAHTVVPVADVIAVFHRNFHTRVANRTDISRGSVAVAHMRRSRNTQEHLLGIPLEEVDGAGEFVAPQAEIDTCIKLLGGFPLDVGIHQGKDGGAAGKLLIGPQHIVYEGRAAVEDGLNRCVVADFIVADAAPSGPKLEGFQIFGLVEPGLVVDAPCGCQRREIAPDVVLELGRAVGAEVKGYHIAAVVGEVRTAQETEAAVASRSVSCGIAVFRGLRQIPVVFTRNQDGAAGAAEGLVIVFLHSLAAHKVDAQFVKLLDPREGILHDDCGIAVHRGLQEVLVHLVILGDLIGLLEQAVAIVGKVHRHVAAPDKILNGSDFHENIAHKAFALVLRV